MANSGYFAYTTVEFASYMTTYGVGALSTAGYAGYDASLTAAPTTSNLATENVRITTAAVSGNPTNITLPAGGLTVNTLNVANVAPAAGVSSGFGFNIDFNLPGDVLNLAGGGIIIQNVSSGTNSGPVVIGSPGVPGVITRRRRESGLRRRISISTITTTIRRPRTL